MGQAGKIGENLWIQRRWRLIAGMVSPDGMKIGRDLWVPRIPSRQPVGSKHHQMAWVGSWHGRQWDVLVEGGEATLVFHGEGEKIDVGDLL